MVAAVTGQVLALAAVAVAALLVSRFTRLELTLSCVLCGFVAGQGVGWLGFDTGIRAHNLEEIVFYVILPVLIFEASWHIKPALLRRWLLPVLLLATLGVIVSCAVTAALLYYGIGYPQAFPWAAALIAGAILAATDPVSVVNQLSAMQAPEDIKTLFEGESLFNDATAVVLFSLFLSLAMGDSSASGQDFLLHFAVVFVGGVMTGVVAGLLTAAVALLLKSPPATAFLQLFTAFGSFYLAEHLLHVSGIMAVMFAALVLRAALSEVEEQVAPGTVFTWEWLGQVFTSLLFVLMGLVITLGMFRDMWLAMLIAIGAALAARACAVLACSLLTYPLRHSIKAGWQLLLFWGGLRGAIAVALVLALPIELDYWYTLQSMVFGVVLFSLLVQGTTNGMLIKRYA
ncbi:MAG: cation:proton antiporter [Halieaceae bacterium]|jgi:CPA1 family monovalent cation:H+ antiporter|nr:cation:proton antiporter [Halieaceae bacterium]